MLHDFSRALYVDAEDVVDGGGRHGTSLGHVAARLHDDERACAVALGEHAAHLTALHEIRTTLAGTEPVAIVAPESGEAVGWVVVDGDALYWLGIRDIAVIERMPIDADLDARVNVAGLGGTMNLGPLLVTPRAFFTTDDFGHLLRIDADSGAQDVFGDNAYRSARDEARVYWSDIDGTVRARAFDGATPEEILVSGQALPYTVAVDACAVYWVDLDDLTVNARAL